MNAKEALKLLLEGQARIEGRLDEFESRIERLEDETLDFEVEAPNSYERTMPLPPGATVRETQPEDEPTPEDKGLELPADWRTMSEEQQHAWLRANTGLTPPPEREAEWETITVDDGLGAAFPPAPAGLREKWAAAAAAIFENWVVDIRKGITIDGDTAAQAYAQAGPLWLAAYAHDFLMGLPQEWRRDMVVDVNGYAPQAGAELGRDILRASLDQAKGSAYDVALWHADQRPTAHS